MKLIKQASGKKILKMSKIEWEAMGKKAGWMTTAQSHDGMTRNVNEFNKAYSEMMSVLSAIEGLFQYRIVGDGARGFISDSSKLTPEEIGEAKRVWGNLNTIKKTFNSVWPKVRELVEDISKIDKFMGYR